MDNFKQELIKEFGRRVVVLDSNITIDGREDEEFALFYSDVIESTFICHKTLEAVRYAIEQLRDCSNRMIEGIKDIIVTYNELLKITEEKRIRKFKPFNISKKAVFTDKWGNRIKTKHSWSHQLVIKGQKGGRYIIFESDEKVLAEELEKFFGTEDYNIMICGNIIEKTNALKYTFENYID